MVAVDGIHRVQVQVGREILLIQLPHKVVLVAMETFRLTLLVAAVAGLQERVVLEGRGRVMLEVLAAQEKHLLFQV